jgi:hypothetical protein
MGRSPGRPVSRACPCAAREAVPGEAAPTRSTRRWPTAPASPRHLSGAGSLNRSKRQARSRARRRRCEAGTPHCGRAPGRASAPAPAAGDAKASRARTALGSAPAARGASSASPTPGHASGVRRRSGSVAKARRRSLADDRAPARPDLARARPRRARHARTSKLVRPFATPEGPRCDPPPAVVRGPAVLRFARSRGPLGGHRSPPLQALGPKGRIRAN